MEEYKNKEEKRAHALIARINKESVLLRIPSENDGWKLSALKSLEVKIHLCSKLVIFFYS